MIRDTSLIPTPYKESLKPFEIAKNNLGERLKKCEVHGFSVDGKFKTVAQVIEIGKHVNETHLQIN